MTEEVKPTPRPAPEELENVQLTPEMVASWVAHDRLEEARTRHERQEEHELEIIERELLNDGVAEEDAVALAPEVRQERIKQDAAERARANQLIASRQVRDLF